MFPAQIIDVFWRHACCSVSSDRIHRPKRVRNLLDRMARGDALTCDGKVSPLWGRVWTSARGCDNPSLARKGLAIDVAVTSPFGSHNLSCTKPCESYAETKKHARYDNDFKGTAFEFVAMVFETTGGVNNEGLELLRQLFRFAAKHQSLQLSVYCGRAWARLSCSLQSSVSQCFLNRAGSAAATERDIDFVDLNF